MCITSPQPSPGEERGNLAPSHFQGKAGDEVSPPIRGLGVVFDCCIIKE